MKNSIFRTAMIVSLSSFAACLHADIVTPIAGPTDFEQYSLELLNRARANPEAEATRIGIIGGINGTSNDPADIAATPTPPIPGGPKQPLAFDLDLIEASRNHNGWMQASGMFSHSEGPDTGVDCWTGDGIGARATAAGFAGFTSGENLAPVFMPLSPTTVLGSHDLLFNDRNQGAPFPRGHRVIILSEDTTVVGVGIDGTNGRQTQMFGQNGNFLTGVAYNDTDMDNFYTPGGEGIGGLTVRATPVGGGAPVTAPTWGSGGYSLALVDGDYNIELVNAANQAMNLGQVTMAGANQKRDAINPVFAVPEPSAFLFLGMVGMAFCTWQRRKALFAQGAKREIETGAT